MQQVLHEGNSKALEVMAEAWRSASEEKDSRVLELQLENARLLKRLSRFGTLEANVEENKERECSTLLEKPHDAPDVGTGSKVLRWQKSPRSSKFAARRSVSCSLPSIDCDMSMSSPTSRPCSDPCYDPPSVMETVPLPGSVGENQDSPDSLSWNISRNTVRLRRSVTNGRSQESDHTTHDEDIEAKKKSLAKKMFRDRDLSWSLFPDKTEMKQAMEDALLATRARKVDLYHNTGLAQSIVTSSWLEGVTNVVIMCNAVWIGFDVDLNPEPLLVNAHFMFQIMENIFCVYYLAEWLLRLCALKDKKHIVMDPGLMFDTILVVLTIIEVWVITFVMVVASSSGTPVWLGDSQVLRMLRLVRLQRAARIVRLLRVVPELVIMVRGMVAALRSVAMTLLLLGIIIYIFAICFRSLTDGTELGESLFRNIPQTWVSLLLNGAIPDHGPFVFEMADHNVGLAAISLFFVFVASLTVLNLLVGVLVEVVGIVSAAEKEAIAANFVKESLTSILLSRDVDFNGDHKISLQEFEALLLQPEVVRCVRQLDIDVTGLLELSDMLFQGGKELTFPELFSWLLQLRGGNTCTVRDMVDMRKFMLQELVFVESGITARLDHYLGGKNEPQDDGDKLAPSRSAWNE